MKKPKLGAPCVVRSKYSVVEGVITSLGTKWIKTSVTGNSVFSVRSLKGDYGNELFIGTIEEYDHYMAINKAIKGLKEEIIDNLEHLCIDNLIKIRDMTSTML